MRDALSLKLSHVLKQNDDYQEFLLNSLSRLFLRENVQTNLAKGICSFQPNGWPGESLLKYDPL